MTNSSFYDELDVPTVINGAGTRTRLSGTLLREESIKAMERGAREFVRLSDLQAAASEAITDATGAEAGYVTSGAAAGLALGAAACIAGKDPKIMRQLPETDGIPDEIVISREQRNGYDHALRTAGATMVEVGETGYNHGCAPSNIEPWEIESAITEKTVAVFWLAKPHVKMDVETVADIAHSNDVPLIVDAAAQLPPVTNLQRYVNAGADLVVFSGGKAIRGPQTTGILAGDEELVQSAALQNLDMHVAAEAWTPPEDFLEVSDIQGVPRQGIGRPMKVGKEEICGLLAALEAFQNEDHDRRQQEWIDRVETLASKLDAATELDPSVSYAKKSGFIPILTVHVDEAEAELSTTELVRSLREEDPRVYVGADDLHRSQFTVNPLNLSDEEANYLSKRILTVLGH